MSITTETTHGVLQSPPQMFASALNEAKPVSNAEAEKQQKRMSLEEVQKKVHEINEQLQPLQMQMSFSVDKETQKVVVKIINGKTQEVVRQIPSEEALRISSHISRLLGVLFDENA